jgi:hypothetical protein
MERQEYIDGTPSEPVVDYSSAVKARGGVGLARHPCRKRSLKSTPNYSPKGYV